MIDAIRDDLHGRPSDSRPLSFNSEQPTKTAIQSGIAVLFFLLVVRFCLQRCVAWRHMSRTPRRFTATQEQTQPALPIFDEKMCPESDSAEKPSSANHPATTTSCTAPRAMPERQQRHFFTRLPPAPPLTPPELSTSIFACNEDVDGFISQPNPDYMSATSSIPFQDSQSIPQTRSYTKRMAFEAPMPDNQGGASSDPTFSPGSCPRSAMLPPPPPVSQDQIRVYEDDTPRRNVNVQGEIISVVNQDGRGWSRHTRVYGGGACLACAASGGHEGGFYGATVTPEEMRY